MLKIIKCFLKKKNKKNKNENILPITCFNEKE